MGAACCPGCLAGPLFVLSTAAGGCNLPSEGSQPSLPIFSSRRPPHRRGGAYPSLIGDSVTSKLGQSPGRRTTHTLALWQSRGGDRGRLQDFYDDPLPLGEGAYGSVSRWRLRTPSCRSAEDVYFAVKQIRWQRIWGRWKHRELQEERIRQELATLVSLDHPYVAMIREWFEDAKDGIFFVMELCDGGSLQDVLDHICSHGALTARWAYAPRLQRYFRDLLYAVSYIHSRGVVHRDLKPDNVMLASADPSSGIKLIDFGLASLIKGGCAREHDEAEVEDERCSTRCGDTGSPDGTMLFMSPELVNATGCSSTKSDMWSLGVILSWNASALRHGLLLHPMVPQEGGSGFDVPDYLLHSAFRVLTAIRKEHFGGMPEACVELAEQLLKYAPQERPRAQVCLENAWVSAGETSTMELLKRGGALENMTNFRRLDAFERSMLSMVAANITNDQAVELRKTFEALDTNKNGSISKQELSQGLEKSGVELSAEEIDAIFAAFKDVNSSPGKGDIDYNDFLSLTMGARQIACEDLATKVFHSLDVTGTGKLRTETLARLLGEEVAREACGKYSRRMSGSLDHADFREAMLCLSRHRRSVTFCT